MKMSLDTTRREENLEKFTPFPYEFVCKDVFTKLDFTILLCKYGYKRIRQIFASGMHHESSTCALTVTKDQNWKS